LGNLLGKLMLVLPIGLAYLTLHPIAVNSMMKALLGNTDEDRHSAHLLAGSENRTNGKS
jgi:hypothetical protein